MRTLILLAAAALSAQATSFYLTVAGLGGEPDYEQRFTTWASDFKKAVSSEAGAKVEVLTGKDATKANILSKLSSFAGQAKADDTLAVFFIGHGSFDGRDAKFNLVGPDMSAKDFGLQLRKVKAGEQFMFDQQKGEHVNPRTQGNSTTWSLSVELLHTEGDAP